ncbi:hypothetical protein [Pedobacter heparinus]|uniref:Uncharacterized protein n=2 Tax=Pedobacter TaxID=84567 RepID=C6Y307_PEDHD|nr:hypothetical protein [Pedobacter heparinus]ACU03220.1 hypothetical protein Phep_0999 [Pedobacter heparinus DSM 2366]
MNMVIFKTSVQSRIDLIAVKPIFNLLFGKKNWLFTFEDKLLRIASSVPCADVVEFILAENGVLCEELT